MDTPNLFLVGIRKKQQLNFSLKHCYFTTLIKIAIQCIYIGDENALDYFPRWPIILFIFSIDFVILSKFRVRSAFFFFKKEV